MGVARPALQSDPLRSPRPGPPGRGLGEGSPQIPRFHDICVDVDLDVDADVDLDANVDADVVAVVLLDESTV